MLFQAMEPTSHEKEKPNPRVSVWDEGLTSIDQAIEFRKRPVLAFRLSADKRALLEKKYPEVNTVYEEITGDQAGKPGAAGHAGMSGMGPSNQDPDRKSKKLHYANVTDDFARVFEFVERVD